MLIHGFSPESMTLGTMIPIPKNKRKSLSDSDNYRSIALSSVIGKLLDIVILLKEEQSFSSSVQQFGFKSESSTTQCSFVMNETIDYYTFNHTNVYVLMLDATKAFDRVHYCKLFKVMLQRKISPIVIRLLMNMYTGQRLQVKWGSSVSDTFSVSNGVKQGGVLSPILFSLYVDGLMLKLKNNGIGCHLGNNYVGALAYADDITLLCPSIIGLRQMIKVCEEYANEYNILFNGAKSQLLMFKGRNCKPVYGNVYVNGTVVEYSESAIHLGHQINVNDRDFGIRKGIANFWKSFNLFMSNFGHINCDTKIRLFHQYCCSFYGAPLWHLHCNVMNDLCIAWRKSLRSLWRLSPMTHCIVIECLSKSAPLHVQLSHRFIKFWLKCTKSRNNLVKATCAYATSNPMSTSGNNYKTLVFKYPDIMNCSKCIFTQSNKTMQVNADIISVLKQMIDVRDGYARCDIFDNVDVDFIINTLCFVVILYLTLSVNRCDYF